MPPKFAFEFKLKFFAVCAMQLLFHAHKYGAAVKASEYVEKEASEDSLRSLEGISYRTAVVSRQQTADTSQMKQEAFPHHSNTRGACLTGR